MMWLNEIKISDDYSSICITFNTIQKFHSKIILDLSCLAFKILRIMLKNGAKM